MKIIKIWLLNFEIKSFLKTELWYYGWFPFSDKTWAYIVMGKKKESPNNFDLL